MSITVAILLGMAAGWLSVWLSLKWLPRKLQLPERWRFAAIATRVLRLIDPNSSEPFLAAYLSVLRDTFGLAVFRVVQSCAALLPLAAMFAVAVWLQQVTTFSVAATIASLLALLLFLLG